MNVELKRLREEHLELVMQWRMLPEITRFMNTDPKLTIDGQRAWYSKIKEDETQKHWVVYVEGDPSGVINIFDIDSVHSRCVWGYYIADKKHRSLKLAATLEWSLYEYVFETLGLERLYCETFTINRQVVKLHELCGSKLEGVLRRHVRKGAERFDVAVHAVLADEWAGIKRTNSFNKLIFQEE